MKLTKKNVGDILVMVEHSRTDMSYGSGGSFSTDDQDFDEKDAKKVERAIELIKKMVLLHL